MNPIILLYLVYGVNLILSIYSLRLLGKDALLPILMILIISPIGMFLNIMILTANIHKES